MDIIVTTPARESKSAKREAIVLNADPDAYWFRRYRFRPRVEPGDRVYFVEGGEITGFSNVIGVEHTGEEGRTCEVTGKVWPGEFEVRFRGWTPARRRVRMRGFRNIRYVKNLSDEDRTDLLGGF